MGALGGFSTEGSSLEERSMISVIGADGVTCLARFLMLETSLPSFYFCASFAVLFLVTGTG